MGANKSSKKFWDGTTKYEFTIQNTVFLTILLCVVSILASILTQVIYKPSWVSTIISQTDSLAYQNKEIRQSIQRLENPDSLLILYGGGTVQSYLETRGVRTNANLIIIPAPSASACNSLGDDVFVRNLIGKIIVMSSKKAEDEDFMVNQKTRSKESSHILEVYIGTDTLYIHTTDKNMYNQYLKKGIYPNELRKLLRENPTGSKIYLTSIQSGTWAEYSKLTNKLIDSDSIRIEEYNRFTSFADKDNFIILTRANYDPLKNKKTTKPHYTIKVKNENGSDKIDSLYFYIPVSFEQGTGAIKKSAIIDKFLTQIDIEIDYSKIENQEALVIRSNDAHYKRKKK